MRALRRWGAGALGLLVGGAAWGCTELGSPLRPAIYGYSMIVTDVVVVDTVVDGVEYFGGDTITDTLDFAWPPSKLPITIWVQDTAGLPGDVTAAIAGWKDVLIYGEIGATIVADSTTADIIIRGTPPPPAPAPRGLVRFGAAPAACEGVTDIFVSAPDHTKLWLPIRVYLTPKFPLTDPSTRPCLARVTMHELGHALGLFLHSPDPADLMYTFPEVDGPSDADAATVLQLYHQQSDLRPVPATDTLPPSPVSH